MVSWLDWIVSLTAVKLNANRVVVGTLRGFDQFMNLVIDQTVEVNGNEKNDIGMVVSTSPAIVIILSLHSSLTWLMFKLSQVIRGNSVVMIEALEPVGRTQ